MTLIGQTKVTCLLGSLWTERREVGCIREKPQPGRREDSNSEEADRHCRHPSAANRTSPHFSDEQTPACKHEEMGLHSPEGCASRGANVLQMVLNQALLVTEDVLWNDKGCVGRRGLPHAPVQPPHHVNEELQAQGGSAQSPDPHPIASRASSITRLTP